MNGYIKLHREIQEHWIWQNEKYLKWWLTILFNVNFEQKYFPAGDKIYVCNPGQSFRSIEKWTAMFSCSKKTTVRFFLMLKNEKMILCETVGKGNQRKHLLTVVNWKKYQQAENEKDLEKVPEHSVNGNPNVTPNKKEKNEKKEKVIFTPPTLSEIESYYEEKLKEKGSTLNPRIEAEKFESFYSSKNWMIGKNKMTDWKKAVTSWIARDESVLTPNPEIKINKEWQ